MKLKSLFITFLTISTILACSKQKFTNTPSDECDNAESCSVNPDGSETYSEVIRIPLPNNKVDILFVVDNSGSMTAEQNEIAYRFNGFVANLRNEVGLPLDYRIAIATTDNQSGSQEWKDGKLVPFRSSPTTATSLYWIDNNTANKETLFSNTVKRPESATCYNNGYSANQCASIVNVSGDERGIMTAVKAAGRYTQAPHAFLRSDAALHVIFVSDEDERSNGGGFSNMPIENNDKPDTLVSALGGLPVSGGSRKRFVLHSIINIPNELTSYDAFLQGGFESCVGRQRVQSGSEFQGCHYAMASVLTGGEIGSIRDSNYSYALNTAIAGSVQDTARAQVDLRCVPSEVTVSAVDGEPYPPGLANPYYPMQVVGYIATRYIVFNPSLPAGSVVRVNYTCPRR